jgi:hypothetical protein
MEKFLSCLTTNMAQINPNFAVSTETNLKEVSGVIFGSEVNAGTTAIGGDTTATVATINDVWGALPGDIVAVGCSADLTATALGYFGAVTAANTVIIRATNATAGGVNAPAGTYTAMVTSQASPL